MPILVMRAAWVSFEISIKCVGALRSFPLPFLSLCASGTMQATFYYFMFSFLFVGCLVCVRASTGHLVKGSFLLMQTFLTQAF